MAKHGREHKVPQVVCLERLLVPVLRQAKVGHGHHPRVIHEDVDLTAIPDEFGQTILGGLTLSRSHRSSWAI